jgi:hypothetical protein
MATQLMFYETVVPVSPQRHGNWCVESGSRYEFAKHVNSVPLVAVEIPMVAREYTVVFADAGEEVLPLVILGLKDTENLYIQDDGSWNAKYLPAFVRRYPFIFSASEDRSKFTLCIDESWNGCNQEGRGQRLFDEQGERTPLLERIMGFHQDYHVNAERTKHYCRRLVELDLLETKGVEFNLSNGEKLSLGGFKVISREKFKELPAETIHEMFQTGELELTYAHLLSLSNLALLADRVTQKRSSQEEPATDEQQAALAGAPEEAIS